MRLDEFRKEQTRVVQARSFFSNPAWSAIKEVLHEEHPARFNDANFTLDQAAMYQKYTAGYEKAMNVLEAMCEEPKRRDVPKTTYTKE